MPSNGMSPKRLKSEHGSLTCTTPRSLSVNSRAKESARASCERNFASQASIKPKSKTNRESEVVHIFPQLCEDMMACDEDDEDDVNTNIISEADATEELKSVHRLSRIREGVDQMDSKSKHHKRSSSDIVSQPAKMKTDNNLKSFLTVASTSSQNDLFSARTTSTSHESLQRLQVLFKLNEDKGASEKEKSLIKGLSEFERPQIEPVFVTDFRSSESIDIPISSEMIPHGKNTKIERKSKELESQRSLFQTVPSDVSPTVSPQSSVLPSRTYTIPRANTGSDRIRGTVTDTAQFALRLQNMQGTICWQQLLSRSSPAHALQSKAPHHSTVGLTTTQEAENAFKKSNTEYSIQSSEDILNEGVNTRTEQDNTTQSEGNFEKESTVSNKPLQSTAEEQSKEEESRTARLCLSKENPFKFTPQGTDAAEGISLNSEPRTHLTEQKSEEASRKEGGILYPDDSATKSSHRAGELACESYAGDGRGDTRHRQLADPCGAHSMHKLQAIVDKAKATTLRQFSDNGDLIKTVFEQPSKRIQKQFRFCTGNCESASDSAEEHAAFFVDEHLAGTRSVTITKGCSSSQGLGINHPELATVSKMEASEINRSAHHSMDYFKHDCQDLNRALHEVYSKPYWQNSTRELHVDQIPTSSKWIRSPSAQMQTVDDKPRNSHVDDSVFEDICCEDRGASPFKSPGAPVGSACYGQQYMARYLDRLTASILPKEITPSR